MLNVFISLTGKLARASLSRDFWEYSKQSEDSWQCPRGSARVSRQRYKDNNNNNLYFVPGNYTVQTNTRDKKLQQKRAQPLRNSKANRAKWLGQAEKNLLIHLLNIEQQTGLRLHTHTYTQITIDKGMCTHKNWKIKYINEPVSSWR